MANTLLKKAERLKPLACMTSIVLVIIFLCALFKSWLPILAVPFSDWISFAAFTSIMYVSSFWVVYYFDLLFQNRKHLNALAVFTLRDYLNETSLTRKHPEKMRQKAQHSLSLVSIFATLTGIIVTLGTVFPPTDPNAKIISQVVSGVNFTALLLLIIAADRLDTCLNEFDATCFSSKKYYSSGIRCAYLGMHLLIVSFIVATLLVNPLVTCGISLLFFAVGYTYWFPARDTPEKAITETRSEKQEKGGFFLNL